MSKRWYPAREAGHEHPEAFCLMHYRTKDGTLTEILWNSRDGVTPFGISSTDGREMTHVDWHLDNFQPDYKPVPGQRIFVTLGRERAEEWARQFVERYWDHGEYPMHRAYPSREDAIAKLTDEYYRDGTAPTVVTVRDDGTW
ncbi:MAG TPA: hypothetical protein VIL85_02945 [Thermomicrobiales bacterium]|jgi:hypothetical protein